MGRVARRGVGWVDLIGEQLGIACDPRGNNHGGLRDISTLSEASVQVVTIEHKDEACGFRVPSNYTFLELARDACRFWNLDPSQSSLRDASNSIWPFNGKVRQVLLEELQKEESAGFGAGPGFGIAAGCAGADAAAGAVGNDIEQRQGR